MKFGDDYINGIMYEKRIRPLIISRPGKHSHVATPPLPTQNTAQTVKMKTFKSNVMFVFYKCKF